MVDETLVPVRANSWRVAFGLSPPIQQRRRQTQTFCSVDQVKLPLKNFGEGQLVGLVWLNDSRTIELRDVG